MGPSERPCSDHKPRVRWAHFFDVEPVGWSEGGGGKPTVHLHTSAMANPALRAYLQRREWRRGRANQQLLRWRCRRLLAYPKRAPGAWRCFRRWQGRLLRSLPCPHR